MVRLLHHHQYCGIDTVLVSIALQCHHLLAEILPVDILLALWLGGLWPNYILAVTILWVKVCRHRLDRALLLWCAGQQSGFR